jgi:hypothetical protein
MCQAFANVSEWEDFWGILELLKFESPFCSHQVKRGLQVAVRTVTHKKQSSKGVKSQRST